VIQAVLGLYSMPGGTALVIDFTLEHKYINSWHHLISYNEVLIIIIFGYKHVKNLVTTDGHYGIFIYNLAVLV
jgi:hypothetical protein